MAASQEQHLAAHHQTMLHKESGIADEIITARGYFTATTKSQVMELGFARSQALVPALMLPVRNVTGEVALYQARPDRPRIKDGKAVKYETPAGATMALDVPPTVRHLIADPGIPLWITEGVKKGDALASRGCCAMALLGVWNWRGSNEHGGKLALPDWESVALNHRQTYIVFDSDVMTKPEVHQALARLKAFLEQRQAKVALIYLSPGAGGAKQGVDDFFVAGHTLEELVGFATSELRQVPRPDAPNHSYRATTHGLVWDKSTRDGTIPVPLTNFTATIIADLVEDDGAESRHIFAMEAQRNGHTTHFQLAASHFTGMGWVVDHLGANALVYPGMTLKDHTRAAIQLLSGEVPTRHIYKHTGWRQIHGHYIYLHAGGAIGAQGQVAGLEVGLESALAHYTLRLPDSEEEERQAMRASLRLLELEPATLMVPVHAAIWRAALGHVEHSLFLAGQTGAGKTAIAALAQQHYGAAMDAQGLPGSWSSTSNALEGLAFLAKDALLVIDDFCPTGSQADIRRYHKDADRVFRAQGNTSARQRMRPDGTLRPAKPPRGLILSTGEDIPDGHSLRARTFVLDVPPETLQNNKTWFTTCQRDASNGLYATAMAGFLRWLAPRYDEVQAVLDSEIVDLRAYAEHGTHLRTGEIMAQLACGIRAFLAYALDRGVLTEDDHAGLWQRAWSALAEAASMQPDHQTSEDPVNRFLLLLPAVLIAGHAHVVDADTGEKPHEPERWGWRYRESVTDSDRGQGTTAEWQPQRDQIGWVRGERLYLEPEAAFRVVAAFAASQQKPFPITQRTLWKRMREQGLLAVEPSQRQNTVRREIGPTKNRKRVIDIAVDVLSAEISPTSPSSPQPGDTNQINGRPSRFPDCLPPWYTPQQSGEPVQSHAASACAASREARTDGGTNLGTASPDGTVHQTSPQRVEKQGAGPHGLSGLQIVDETSREEHDDNTAASSPQAEDDMHEEVF
jgi:hypothetical protein